MSTVNDRPDERAAYTTGLRELADWLDAHPQVPLPYLGAHPDKGDFTLTLPIYVISPYDDDDPAARDVLAGVARAMGKANKTTNRAGDRMVVWRRFGGIAVAASAPREEVCERIVIGSHPVTELVPDPDAVAALPKVPVTRIVEDIEWRCTPLLSDVDER